MNSNMKLALEEAFKAGFLAGFGISAEGHNAEYPFADRGEDPKENPYFKSDLDDAVNAYIEAVSLLWRESL